MKNLKKIIFLVCLITPAFLFAQDKIEKLPKPVGGMAALMKNIDYPEQAKKEGISGKVFVKAVINESGKVISAEVIKSDNKVFNDAAIKATMKTPFTPGENGGKKVKAEVTIPFSFKLK